jgi:hypothetical protein
VVRPMNRFGGEGDTVSCTPIDPIELSAKALLVVNHGKGCNPSNRDFKSVPSTRKHSHLQTISIKWTESASAL